MIITKIITDEIVKEAIKKSFVPVFIMNISIYKKDFYEFNYTRSCAVKIDSKVNGEYIHHNFCMKEWPEKFVFIRKNLSNCLKMTTFFHELGHALCHKKDCNCHYFDNKVLAEVHAYKHQLEMCLKKKLLPCVKKSIREIKIVAEEINEKTFPIYYNNACKKVIETAIWEKCNNFLEENKKNT